MTAALPTVCLILICAVLTAVSDRIDLLILAYHALLLRVALRLLSSTTCYNKKKSVLIIYSSIIKCLISSRRERSGHPMDLYSFQIGILAQSDSDSNHWLNAQTYGRHG